MSVNSRNVCFEVAKLYVPSNEAFISRHVSLMLGVCDDRVASPQDLNALVTDCF